MPTNTFGKPLSPDRRASGEFGTEVVDLLVNALLELRHAMDKITLLMDCFTKAA